MLSYVVMFFISLIVYSAMQILGAYLRLKHERELTKSKMDAIKHQSEQETQKLQAMVDKIQNQTERKRY